MLLLAASAARHSPRRASSSSSTSQSMEMRSDTWWPKEGSPVAPADSYLTWDVRTPVKLHMTEEYPGCLPPITIPKMFRYTICP